MDLRSLLTEEDKTRLKNYINDFAGATMDCTDVDKVLAEWARAKEDLYHALGDQLIVEFPVEYSRPESDISDECYNLIYGYNVINPSFRNMFTALDTYWRPVVKDEKTDPRQPDTYHFNQAYEWDRTYWPSSVFNDCGMMASNTLADWVEGYAIQNKETGKVFTFHKGEKYFRALGKLIHNCPVDQNAFEEFRIKVSQITNQKTLKGTMCISIHPMDYITMSDNDYDWDSCMNWTSDEGGGDYRLGTVEMMNSPMVVCAYLKGDGYFQWDNYQNKGDPVSSWNSKKWRELFIVRDDFNIEIKAYPYDNEEFTKLIMDKLEELMHNTHEEEIWWNYQTRFNDDELELGFQTNDNGMYNDFGTYRNQKGHLMRYNKKLVSEWTANRLDRKYINYSGEPHCMCCGDLIQSYAAQSNQVVCGNCGDYEVERCSCCGCSIYDDEDVFWSYDTDSPYCSACYNDLYVHDDITDEDIRREDAIQFCLMDYDIVCDTTTIDTPYGPKPKINDYLDRHPMYHATLEEVIDEFKIEPHVIREPRYSGRWQQVYYYTFDEMIKNDEIMNFFGFIRDDHPYYQARSRRYYSNNEREILNLEQQIEAYKEQGSLVWYHERKPDRDTI